MKKAITIFALIILYICGKAQQVEIISIDFEPDSCIMSQNAKLWVDFDNDGNGALSSQAFQIY